MPEPTIEARIACLRQEADTARSAGDLPAAAFGYAAALSMLPLTGADAQTYDLRLARASCLHGAGDYKAEAEELVHLDTLAARLDEPSRRVTVALRRANMLIVSGDVAAAQLIAATALAEAEATTDEALAADSLFTLAEAAYYLSDFGTAKARAERAMSAYQGLRDRRGEAQARRLLGLAALASGRSAGGMEQLRASLELCRAIGDRAGEALALNAIGIGTTDRAEARAVYIQGLAISESTGDRESEAMLANNLGVVYLSLGLYGQARAYASRAVRLARALGARDMLAAFLETQGQACGGLGQIEPARIALREAYALAESIGSRTTAAATLVCLARVALAEGHHVEAAADLDKAIVLSRSVDAYAEEATALAWRAAAHLMADEVRAAQELTERAVALLEYGGGSEFPAQEVWWQRYRALIARPEPATAGPGGACAAPCGGQADSPEAAMALAQARVTMYKAISTLSDAGLRRSYLGRVVVNRAILEAEACAHVALGEPVYPPMAPSSHVSLQDQLTRMLGVSARLNDLRDAAALREMFLDEVVELSGAERLLLLIGPAVEAPEAAISRGVGPAELPALRAAAMPHLREVVRRRRAMLHEDPGDLAEPSPPALRSRSAIAVPLISGARTVGALYADVHAFFGPFTSGDLDLIGLLAAQAATALENARLYAQILRAKEELERQVAERTADLRAANRALETRAAEAQGAHAAAEAASAAKSAFLANVSHELRTPLNAVIGFAQVLGRDPELAPRHHDLVQIIARSGNHLLGMINDVLELSKIEAGRLRVCPAPFDLHRTLGDLDGLFRLRADVRQLSFAVNLSPALPRYVVGDEGRMRQVLINLLSNALKFTHAGGVTVDADAVAAGSHLRVRIAVADTGEGIAPEELENLFRPFIQSESGRRTQEGTGLGLVLSRQIARLMGGDITVTSTPDVGSVFTVELQLDPAVGPADAPQSQAVAGLVTAGRRYRALVADSHWQQRRLLAEWLQEAGVEVREATDGAQTLETWADWRPHVVLLDPNLPVIDGPEAARRIKESPGGRATVIIGLASDAGDAPRDLARQVPGCDDTLPGHVRHDELLSCIARHLGLDLRYTEATAGQHPPPLSPADLAGLPREVRTHLARAAAMSDPAIVEEAIARIRVDWPALGIRLAALADEFQFERIEQLVEGALIAQDPIQPDYDLPD